MADSSLTTASRDAASGTAAPYRPLAIVAVAFAAGILADRGWPLGLGVWLGGSTAAWCAWCVLWRAGRGRAVTFALAAAVAGCGAARHHVAWHLTGADDLASFAGAESEPVCVEATALAIARRVPAAPFNPLRAIPTTDQSELHVRIDAVRDGDRWRMASGTAELSVAGHLLGVAAGDRLRIFAQLSKPSVAVNPHGLDFANLARSRGVRSRLWAGYPDCVTILAHGAVWRPSRLLGAVQARGESLIWRHVPEASARLASGLLLGRREQLDPDQSEAFMRTGLAHLLAISGLHVGMLAAALFALLRLGLLPHRAALLAVAGVTVGYMLVVGAPPPTLRAATLVVVVCGGLWLGRRPAAGNALALAALLVLLLSPSDLFQTGAQLSFLAAATLAWFSPRFANWRKRDAIDRLVESSRPWWVRVAMWPGRWFFRLAAVSACVWVVALPLVMLQFHRFSPVAVLLTPVVWLPVAVALLSGFATMTLGWLVPPLGTVCGAVCGGALSVVDTCAQTVAGWPGSHVWVSGPEAWWVIGFYVALAACVVVPRNRLPRRWCAAVLIAWMGVGFFAAAAARRDVERLECTFLSVGHGLAVVLELPGGETLLYDAGRLGSPEFGAASIADFLWSRGITHLDAVVLSHADVDHYNAVPELLERFSVGAVYASPDMLRDDGAAVRTLVSAIEEHGVPLEQIWASDRLRTGSDCHIEVLHPPPRGVLGNDNANSVVLAVEYQGRRILLTGDLEPPGLDDVLAEEPLDVDVALAPHHGSNRSNPPGFAAWCTPEWIVVSGGRYSEVAQVAADYRDRGCEVLHTGRDGAVSVTIEGGRVTVRGWLEDGAR